METRSDGLAVYVLPLAWSVFSWAYLLVATQAARQTFYALVRGVGAVRTIDAIVVWSPELDLAALAMAAAALGVVQVAALRRRALWPPALISLVALGLGTAGALTLGGPAPILVLGLAGFATVATGVVGVSEAAASPQGRPIAVFALFLTVGLAVVAASGDIRWVAGGLDGSTPLRSPDWGVALAGLQLTALLDPLIPVIVLAFLFAWAVRLAVPAVLRALGGRNVGAAATEELHDGRKATWILLAGGAAVAIFASVYPYLPAVNPQGVLVGVDVRYCYSNILAGMPVSGPCGTNGALYELEHYGAFVMLRGLVALTGSIPSALMAAPPILAALMVASTWALAFEATGSKLVAGVAALFSATSPELIAGVNAGLIGNWLAMSLVFIFFAAVMHGLRTREPRYVLAASGVSVLLLAVHPWTWAVSLGVAGSYLLLRVLVSAARGKLGERKLEIYLLGAVILVALAADAAFTLLFSRSGIGIAVSTVDSVLSLPSVSSLALNFRETFVMFLLGGFANPLWFVLAAAGVLAIRSLRSESGGLLAVWLGAISIGVLLIGTGADPTLMARFLYMLPVQVFEGMGLVAVVSRLGAGFTGPSAGRLRFALLAVALAAVVGLQLGFALDNVGFLYRGIPGT